MTKAFFFLFLLLPCVVCAQFSISGKILNSNDNHPVANASVFLSNATIGGTTDNNGDFILVNVKAGTYNLIVSTVGFSAFSKAITIDRDNISLPAIFLSPQAVALSEVRITAKEDPARQSNLELFKNQFLGTSELAKECKIINPELLDLNFDENAKILTAKSADFLVIENHALGYRIKYLLSDFRMTSEGRNAGSFFYEGSVLFEQLKGNASEEKKWQQRRQEIYANSNTHFLRAALNNQLAREGFSVIRFPANPERPSDSLINEKIKVFNMVKDQRPYRDSLSYWTKKSKLPKWLSKQVPEDLSAENIIQQTNKPGTYALGFGKDALYVVYNKAHQFNARSLNHLLDQNNTSSTLVTFNSPLVFFDRNGAILNAGSLTYAGAWANKRLAELLPVDYEPGQMPVEVPADSSLIKKINECLASYTSGHGIEKAYLHFDKPYYAAGDTVYFKAYVTGPFYQPSTISNILHADLIGPANEICESVPLRLEDGMAVGDIPLADTLKRGTYRLRAYTNTMRNAGDAYFFDQSVVIVNEPVKASQKGQSTRTPGGRDQPEKSSSKNTTGKIDVQFFPEGGKLIDGISSKIAFKAVAPNGMGTDITGTITDDLDQIVATFASQHLGMGSITITPLAGRRYQANVISAADSAKATFDLPGMDKSGYALSVENADVRNLRINISAGARQVPPAQLNLVAQSGGVVYAYIACRLVNNHFSAIIPKDSFPDGIVQFTLFNQSGEPTNERLVFIQNSTQLNLKITTEKQRYTAREKIRINLTANDRTFQPVAGNFSVAVTDEALVPVNEDNESTILSHLLLTSDIKGFVERPNYYFKGKSDQAAADLDVLMLTQGYHRFEWKLLMGNQYPAAVFGPERMSSISGRISNLNKEPSPNAKVSLASVSNVFFYSDTLADADGNFVFRHLPVIDSIRYIIQATDKQTRKNTLIALDDQPPNVGDNKIPQNLYNAENDSLGAFFNASRLFHSEQIRQGFGTQTILLKEVTIKEETTRKYLRHSSNLNGAGVANEVITSEQIPLGCAVLTDCLAGHLHGIHFVDGMPYYERFQTLVMVDGMQIIAVADHGRAPDPSVADIVNMLNIKDIASIEVITDASRAAIYGMRGGGGVILITTKWRDDVAPDMSKFKPAFAYYSPAGYYKARVFYSPRYNLAKTNAAIPDLRTTIYWNPGITTDRNGNAEFEFFNADTKGNYRVVVEGIDGNGHIGRQVYHYKVE